MGLKSIECLFLVYGKTKGHKTYRFFEKLKQQVIFCQDVSFNILTLILKEGGKINEPLYWFHIGEHMRSFHAFK